MSKNISEAHIIELMNKSNDGSCKIVNKNGYTFVYNVNPSVVNDFPKVGTKRKYPFDITQENQHNGVKKFRSN
jgi:hypothetical protein